MRRLNGWEPTETTTIHYAPVVWWKPWTWHKVIGTTSRREPEFDDEQTALLLASVEFEASIDSNGHLLADTMSDDADPTNYESDLRFSAKGPFFNWAEKARLDDIDRYKSEFPKDSPPNLNGAYWVVEKHGESAAERVHADTDHADEHGDTE